MDIKQKRRNLRIWLLVIMTVIPFLIVGIMSYMHAINWGFMSYFFFVVYTIFLGVPYVILCWCVSWIITRLIYRDQPHVPK